MRSPLFLVCAFLCCLSLLGCGSSGRRHRRAVVDGIVAAPEAIIGGGGAAATTGAKATFAKEVVSFPVDYAAPGPYEFPAYQHASYTIAQLYLERITTTTRSTGAAQVRYKTTVTLKVDNPGGLISARPFLSEVGLVLESGAVATLPEKERDLSIQRGQKVHTIVLMSEDWPTELQLPVLSGPPPRSTYDPLPLAIAPVALGVRKSEGRVTRSE